MEIVSVKKRESISRPSKASARKAHAFSVISPEDVHAHEVHSTTNIASIFSLNVVDSERDLEELAYENADQALRQLNNIKNQILYGELSEESIVKLHKFLSDIERFPDNYVDLYSELKTLVFVEHAKMMSHKA